MRKEEKRAHPVMVRVAFLAALISLVGCAHTPRLPDAMTAVNACNHALEGNGEKAPEERQAEIAKTCGLLLTDPACRSIFSGTPSEDQRQSQWVLSCLPGYCGVMDEPLPDLCIEERRSADPISQTTQKEEFFERALFLDLGRDAFESLDRRWIVLLSHTALTTAQTHGIIAMPSTERNEAQPEGLNLLLSKEGDRVSVKIEPIEDRHWEIPMLPHAEEKTELSNALLEFPSLKSVNIVTGSEIPYASIVWLIELVVSIDREAAITLVLVE